MASPSKKPGRRPIPAKRAVGTESEAPPKAARRGLWTGSLSFGLLQIPVSIVTAERKEDEIHFRQLHRKDLSPIRYERVNSTSGEAVEWKDIVKGYEYEKDTFVVLEDSDLKKANVKATQTIDIQDFVDDDSIAPSYFETPYFLVPQKRAAKAYVLLRAALSKLGTIAIATFVLRTREHLCAIRAVGDALMLEVLRFAHQLRAADDVDLPAAGDVKLSAREVEMAEKLVAGMKTSWEPTKYRDNFHTDVERMIAQKVKTGKVTAHAKPHGTRATEVVDLIDLLKASIAQHTKGGAKNDDSPAKHRARGRKGRAA